ncbi:MAG: hypothetical protein M0P30_13765 [Syntrophorhabdaceae bacterium]|nr:hypothetical protein [Syntrophorhabdaceae bacterium]
MIPGEAIKKTVGIFIPIDEDKIDKIDSLSDVLGDMNGDEAKEFLATQCGMKMEMYFKEGSIADQGKELVNKGRSQINKLESILLSREGQKQEFRPSSGVTEVEDVRQLMKQIMAEGASIASIDNDYRVLGVSPLDVIKGDKDIDPATLRVMAQRMSADISRYRQARLELESEAPKDTPENDFSPASSAPMPGMNMRPGI